MSHPHIEVAKPLEWIEEYECHECKRLRAEVERLRAGNERLREQNYCTMCGEILAGVHGRVMSVANKDMVRVLCGKCTGVPCVNDDQYFDNIQNCAAQEIILLSTEVAQLISEVERLRGLNVCLREGEACAAIELEAEVEALRAKMMTAVDLGEPQYDLINNPKTHMKRPAMAYDDHGQVFEYFSVEDYRKLERIIDDLIKKIIFKCPTCGSSNTKTGL